MWYLIVVLGGITHTGMVGIRCTMCVRWAALRTHFVSRTHIPQGKMATWYGEAPYRLTSTWIRWYSSKKNVFSRSLALQGVEVGW